MLHTPSAPQTCMLQSPKSMIGRIIGKGGETIKALQQYTGAVIQIDQSTDPTKVTVAGDINSVELAAKMIKDIVEGNFKGFAMLRQLGSRFDRDLYPLDGCQASRPVYVHGYGIVPPSQFSDSEESSKTELSAGSFGPHTPAKSSMFEVQSALAATATSPPQDMPYGRSPNSVLELENAVRYLNAQNQLAAQMGLSNGFLPGPAYTSQGSYGNSHALLQGLEGHPSMMGLLDNLQGPLTPQQQLPTLAPSQEELLWQYRAQMAPQMAPSSVTSPFSSVPTTLPSQPMSASAPVMRNLFGTNTPRAASQDAGSGTPFRRSASEWLSGLPAQREMTPRGSGHPPLVPSASAGGALGSSPPSVSTGARWWASGSSSSLGPEGGSPLAPMGSGSATWGSGF